jgi:hypothetical protein
VGRGVDGAGAEEAGGKGKEEKSKEVKKMTNCIAILSVTILVVLFWGEPDIHDYVLQWLELHLDQMRGGK